MPIVLPYNPLNDYVTGEPWNQTVARRCPNELLADILALRDGLNEFYDMTASLGVVANNPNDNRVLVKAGVFIKSDNTRVLRLAANTQSPIFNPVLVGGNVRYDLLQIDDTSTIQVKEGIEVLAPGDPFVDHPNIDADKMTLAIIRVTETGTAVIATNDITDAREFLNKGGGGGGIGVPEINELYTATLGQTVFNLASAYRLGTGSLLVFANGDKQTKDTDYTETDPDTVTFLRPLEDGEVIHFLQFGGGGARTVITARTEVNAAPAQTIFSTGFAYIPGNKHLLVFVDGVLKRLGAGEDYLETNGTTVTFNAPMAGTEEVTFFRIGTNDASTPALYNRQTATAGQTVFNLPTTFPLSTYALIVFRNGKKLIPVSEYAETTNQQVTLVNPCVVGDELEFMVLGGDVELAAHDLNFHSDVTANGANAFLAAQDAGASINQRLGILSDLGRLASTFHGFYSGLAIDCDADGSLTIKAGLTCVDQDLSDIIKTTADRSVDMAVTGPGGHEVGLVESGSTWYYIWIIKNPSTGQVEGMISASATAPVMPTGYTKKRLIGAVRNDLSSNFIRFIQRDDEVEVGAEQQVYSGGLTTNYSAISFANYIPLISTTVKVRNSIYHTDAAVFAVNFLRGNRSGATPAGSNAAYAPAGLSGATNTLIGCQNIQLGLDQYGSYRASTVNATGVFILFVQGYRLSL